ncbi:response regulator transcription factor [Mesorhizobium sp. M1C.F.Ca.ET.193.01.1.1]|uniref:winged helix-turn-helix transcriptional regulator n=1 Tax=unclassified Mesorhizobium TaxID=325217 RepID=UPI000FD3E17A|nr:MULTISPECIES: response regulator transcription factor [unclassified Mesorhizobium]TGS92278.1 response regulator transcription factor [bacterium M00.F.Ca.ET.177.01.1.1]RWG83382.1 MAG: response regulator transcription factor [Mesorhizobium sp.]RWK14157.1 MAG: response regulator transcription factor [Mesorhizobium sp.]TGQ50172.1 response regulator transcription factor [Mesorhizobium sp. M1C.F.Ca.ET.210.01.1.1]TGQ64861.1 response regulator transcription factor [Mesorhizobium sp. M1C.F.Ca.ET.212
MEFRILIYSRDAQLFLLLQHVLATEGFVVSLAGGANDILKLVFNDRVRAVVIDGSATRLDLYPFRAKHPHVSFILLLNQPVPPRGFGSAMADADLVLTRPFDPSLLIQFLRRLRVEAVVTKRGTRSAETPLRFADLEMNSTTVKVRRNGHEVPLTALQFRLLRHLLKDPEVVQSRDALIAACWSREAEVEPRTVDIHMGHIRRALKKYGPDLIRTVRSHGYALAAEASPDNHPLT